MNPRLTYLTQLTSIFPTNDGQKEKNKEIHYAWILEYKQIFAKPYSNAHISHYIFPCSFSRSHLQMWSHLWKRFAQLRSSLYSCFTHLSRTLAGTIGGKINNVLNVACGSLLVTFLCLFSMQLRMAILSLPRVRIPGELNYLPTCLYISSLCIFFKHGVEHRWVVNGYFFRPAHFQDISTGWLPNSNLGRSCCPHNFQTSYEYLTNYQSEDSCAHEMVIQVPPIMLTSDPRMVSYFEQVVQSLSNT